VTIYRETEISRETDFQQNGPLTSASINDEFDKGTLVMQELRAQIRRCLRLPITADVDDADIELGPISNWLSKYVYIGSGGTPEPATALTTTPLSQSVIADLLIPQTAAEAAAGVTPTPGRLHHLPGNIRRYGATVDGTTDDAPAFRKALDLAAYDGTTLHCAPSGNIKLNSTVYLPQRQSLVGSRVGYLVSLYGSTLIGQGNGTGTILETGTGTASTGGSSNSAQSNESTGSIHWGTVIEGARFKNFDTAIHLFNFIQGCAIRDVWGEDGDRLIYAKRCFYLNLDNCVGRLFGLGATDGVFHFDGENNVINISARPRVTARVWASASMAVSKA
jgi:hypothetical protein